MFKQLIKLCIVTIITLILLILIKKNYTIKNVIYDNVYNNNISFARINKIYKKYFGRNLFIESKITTKDVFNEKIVYNSKNKYKNGVSLEVDDNYIVPNLEDGLVIFKGKKEEYGNVVIIQQSDGIEVWYGNLEHIDVKLYEYVGKGKLIGSCNNKLFLAFKKNGVFLDYEDKI